MQIRSTDVLILGAGPAGSAMASALRCAGVEGVILVDSPATAPFHTGAMLPLHIEAVLAQLGLENDLERVGYRPFSKKQTRLSNLSGIEPGGWLPDRRTFETWLRRQALQSGATLIAPATITAINPGLGGWHIAVNEAERINARIVVDAAGRGSPLATRLGVRRYRLDSLMGFSTLAEPGDGSVPKEPPLLEAFADGWWYAAPTADGQVMVSLMSDQDIAVMNGFRDPAIFASLWEKTEQLVQWAPPSKPKELVMFAAESGFLNRAAGPDWVAIGDALMTLDPLTRSGINDALNDALAAIPVILSALDGLAADEAARYARRADAILGRHLTEHLRQYAELSRWPKRTFWRRRASAAGTREISRMAFISSGRVET